MISIDHVTKDVPQSFFFLEQETTGGYTMSQRYRGNSQSTVFEYYRRLICTKFMKINLISHIVVAIVHDGLHHLLQPLRTVHM